MDTARRPEKHTLYLDELLRQLNHELACLPGHYDPLRTLRVVLRAIRNRLEFETAVRFVEPLPLPLKAVYVGHWDVPDRIPDRLRSTDDLIDEIAQTDPDFFAALHHDRQEVRYALEAVLRVMARHVSPSEPTAELNLPNDMRDYLRQHQVGERADAPDSCVWLP